MRARTQSIEELSGRLSASEGRREPEQDDAGRLLLTAEEWAARAHQSGQRSSPAQKNSGKQKPQGSGSAKDKGA
jgi:hypothetical protein